MKKQAIYLIGVITLVLFIIGLIIFKTNSNQLKPQPLCQNKEHQVSLTLQSGEKGKLFLTDNHCELRPNQPANELSFKVLPDGALEDSIYQSKLYFWSRDNKLSSIEQIKNLVNQLAKDKLCQVEKNNYPQRDGLLTYGVRLANESKSDCLLFGQETEFASEVFIETDKLLILQRQVGLDGIEPFNLASIKFIQD